MTTQQPKVGDIWRCRNRMKYLPEYRHALVISKKYRAGFPAYGIIWLETGENGQLGFTSTDWDYERVA